MTPKEKAKELLTKYTVATWIKLDEIKYLTTIPTAHECALIAVDEIIHTLNYDIRDLDVIGNVLLDLIKYWRQVKEEIERL